MHSEITEQVDCDWCLNRDEGWHKEVKCPRCEGTRKVPNPRRALCNLCGECTRPLGTYNEQYEHGLENLEVIGGYDSTHLLDLHSYKFSLCEECLRKIFNQCKIPPVVHEVSLNNLGPVFVGYDKDKESYDYSMWCSQGGHHLAYLNRKCNSVKDCPNNAIYTIYLNDHFSEDAACEEHCKRYTSYPSTYRLVQFIPNVLKPFL